MFEVNIDFDAAHVAWMQNKRKRVNATYTYICGHPTRKGHRCLNPQNARSKDGFCHLHMYKRKVKNEESNNKESLD